VPYWFGIGCFIANSGQDARAPGKSAHETKFAHSNEFGGVRN